MQALCVFEFTLFILTIHIQKITHHFETFLFKPNIFLSKKNIYKKH